ncbi:MAG: hypothetical protein HY296_00325 [Thaumarchaeota archaeon]|nr:hypothetical protein [Nitrososphaerota archaeon]
MKKSLAYGVALAVCAIVLASALYYILPADPNCYKPIGCLKEGVRVTYVKPVFTISPYFRSYVNGTNLLFVNGSGSFYSFYEYASRVFNSQSESQVSSSNGMPPPRFITTNLEMLSSKVVLDKWTEVGDNFTESPILLETLTSIVPSVKTITDIDVNEGALFSNGIRTTDVLVLGHEEYVTDFEYSQFAEFVATGGKIVAVDGNTFYAKVNYSAQTNMETFVAGHGLEFNGTAAWQSASSPFDNMSTNWFGSIFLPEPSLGEEIYVDFAVVNHSGPIPGSRIFYGYNFRHWDVNFVTNFTGTDVLATFYDLARYYGVAAYYAPTSVPIDVYCHHYRQGVSCSFGIFGEYLLLKGDRDAKNALAAMVIRDV